MVPIDIGEQTKPIVEMSNSEVMHTLVAIHVLVEPDSFPKMSSWAREILKDLSLELKNFLKMHVYWHYQALEMCNLLPYIKIFSNIKYFGQALLEIEPTKFLSLFYDNIPIEEIRKCFEDPNYLLMLKEQYPIILTQCEGDLRKLFYDSVNYRKLYVKLMEEIAPAIRELLKKEQVAVDFGQERIKDLLAQYSPGDVYQQVLGKKIPEVSEWKRFVFCTTPLIVPYKLRAYYEDTSVLIIPTNFYISTTKYDDVKKVLKVLDDEKRIFLLKYLMRDRSYGKKLAAIFGLTTATISHHLDQLKEVGFVAEEREGNIKFFQGQPQVVKEALDKIAKFVLESD